jgi:hypothetical protein
VVLVGKDAAVLGEAVCSSADQGSRERLLAVVVGDPDEPAVMLAAQEMAAELWQWAGEGWVGEQWAGERCVGERADDEAGAEP